MSFPELLVLLLVAMVVLGPKELPRYLKKAGQFAGRIRRMAYEMREKSGIDEVLRTEGIDRDIAEIRRLARGEIGGVVAAVRSTTDAIRPTPPVAAPSAYAPTQLPSAAPGVAVDREREYPSVGADSYGALPDGAQVYDGALASSPLAADALYTSGHAPAEPRPDELPETPAGDPSRPFA